MSSLKLDAPQHVHGAEDEWIVVRSPRAEESAPSPEAKGVVLSLRARREALTRGLPQAVEVEFTDAEPPDEAASEIASDLDQRWDN